MGIYANVKIIQEEREEIYESIDQAIKRWLKGFKIELMKKLMKNYVMYLKKNYLKEMEIIGNSGVFLEKQ